TEPVTLGTTISSTGGDAPLAAKWRDLTIEFARMINERGGIDLKSCGAKLPVKFVIYDDRSEPDTAAALFERLATVDRVDFLVGPDGARKAAAAAVAAEKHKIPALMSNVVDPQVFRRGNKYVWGTPLPTVANRSARYFDMLSRQTPRPKTIFFLTQDHPSTVAISEIWPKRAAQMGFNVLSTDAFPADRKDFTALILKLRLRRPDVVYIFSLAGPSAALLQQMRKLNLRARDVHHAMPSGVLAKRIGDGLEGVTGSIPWYPGVKGPLSDFAEELLERAGIDLFDSPQTMSRIVAYLIMIQAVERAGAVDREKVRQVLHTGSFDMPIGPVSFDQTGFAHRNGAITLQIQKGRPVIVWPPEIATGKLMYPSPSWQ
ncbi:MAG: amino acid ABC transporter substrate-binding protein, partial [Alphaproteobacteria bacterium]